MKNKTKFRDLKMAFRVSIIAIVTVFVINILSFFFVLLPIYSLVGDSSMTDIEIDNKLQNLDTASGIVLWLTIALIAFSVVSGGYGLFQDVKAKSKK